MKAWREFPERATASEPGGAVKASSCHSSHGPGGIRSGSEVSIRHHPISGRVARVTSPPRAWASSWPPKQTPSTGMPAVTAPAINARSGPIHGTSVSRVD